MKNITISIVALLAMNTAVFAGGDIAPVEPEVMVPEQIVESTPGAFYVGLGYSYMNMNIAEDVNYYETDITADSVLFLAGYNFNQYIGVEGRYTMNVGDVCVEPGSSESADMTNWGIYLKPMYPIGGVTVYGLLGYGETALDNGASYSGDGFQWGLGANYAFNDNIGVFVDYTRLYDDTGFDGYRATVADVMVDSINVGVTYTF